MPKLAVQRLALGAGHVGQLLAFAKDAHAPCRRSSGPSGVKRTTRRVRSTSVDAEQRSRARASPADRVDWVTKQASAALPKWPCCASATRYWSCLRVGQIAQSSTNPINSIDIIDLND